jgi:hypothetical protein
MGSSIELSLVEPYWEGVRDGFWSTIGKRDCLSVVRR